MDLSWDDVRVLLALLRTNSLSGAAKKLGVDRSTMSRRAAALEQALGSALFLRTRDGLRAAAAAERLRPHAERVEAAIKDFERAAAATSEGASGVVRVATTEALGATLVEQGILDVRRDYPDVTIEILGANKPADVARGEAEIALRLVPLHEAALKARCIAKLGFGLYAATSYLRARGKPALGAGLEGHDVLVPSDDLARLPEAQWLLSQRGARVALRSSSMPALFAACVAGHGLAVLTRAWGDRSPGIEQVYPLDELPPRPLWLVVQPDVAKRPEVRVVVEHISVIMERLTQTKMA